MPHQGLRAIWCPKDDEDEHFFQDEVCIPSMSFESNVGAIVGNPLSKTIVDASESFGDAANFINGYNWEGWGTNILSGTAYFGTIPGANSGPPSSAAVITSGAEGAINGNT